MIGEPTPLVGAFEFTPELLEAMQLRIGEELGPAMKQAVRGMVDFLVQEKGMAPYDAYTLLSLAGDVRVSRTFRQTV